MRHGRAGRAVGKGQEVRQGSGGAGLEGDGGVGGGARVVGGARLLLPQRQEDVKGALLRPQGVHGAEDIQVLKM